MSKSKRRIDDKKQLTIFDMVKDYSSTPSSPRGTFRILENLKDAMRAAIKACPLSRHEIAFNMTTLLTEIVTKEQIDSWTRESDKVNGRPERHIPAEYIPAFCRATGSMEPLKVMGIPCGIFIMPGPEALRAEIQKIDEEIREAQGKKKKRMIFLKEMEKD